MVQIYCALRFGGRSYACGQSQWASDPASLSRYALYITSPLGLLLLPSLALSLSCFPSLSLSHTTSLEPPSLSTLAPTVSPVTRDPPQSPCVYPRAAWQPSACSGLSEALPFNASVSAFQQPDSLGNTGLEVRVEWGRGGVLWFRLPTSVLSLSPPFLPTLSQIGRASCRERV